MTLIDYLTTGELHTIPQNYVPEEQITAAAVICFGDYEIDVVTNLIPTLGDYVLTINSYKYEMLMKSLGISLTTYETYNEKGADKSNDAATGNETNGGTVSNVLTRDTSDTTTAVSTTDVGDRQDSAIRSDWAYDSDTEKPTEKTDTTTGAQVTTGDVTTTEKRGGTENNVETLNTTKTTGNNKNHTGDYSRDYSRIIDPNKLVGDIRNTAQFSLAKIIVSDIVYNICRGVY